MRATVAAEFAKAGLTLIVERDPIERGRWPVDIVQIDIARARGAEWFRLFPGHHANDVEIADVDRSHCQLVMTVLERRRAYEARVGDTVVERFTRGVPQHYLCGQDESHLFIAQLPRHAPTIARAHALLAPIVPADYAEQPWIRQGEWFFFPTIVDDATELERVSVLGYGLRTNVGIAEAARWQRTGRPHVVSELRVLKGSPAQPGRRVFVRGDVCHPDHRTLRLRDWHRVLPNRETSNRRGVLWVD